MVVIRTNWINITGVFIITYLYVIADVLIHSGTFIQAVLGGLISICLYGMMFWGLFVVSLIALDLLVIMRKGGNSGANVDAELSINPKSAS